MLEEKQLFIQVGLFARYVTVAARNLMDIRQKIQTLLAAPNYHPLRRDDLGKKLPLPTSTERRVTFVVCWRICWTRARSSASAPIVSCCRAMQTWSWDELNSTTRALPSCGLNCPPT